MTLTIREAQQAKMVLAATITEALNTFTARTGLRVDSVDITTEIRYGCEYDTRTRNFVKPEVRYEVTVSVSM